MNGHDSFGVPSGIELADTLQEVGSSHLLTTPSPQRMMITMVKGHIPCVFTLELLGPCLSLRSNLLPKTQTNTTPAS